jgi:Rieske Fe-S protein
MDYSPTRGQFVCPVHASLFDWEGQVVGGPAVLPIRVFFAGLDGDTVWVGATD